VNFRAKIVIPFGESGNYENDRSSPDGNGILFLAPLARKRYSGQQEIAPKNPKF